MEQSPSMPAMKLTYIVKILPNTNPGEIISLYGQLLSANNVEHPLSIGDGTLPTMVGDLQQQVLQGFMEFNMWLQNITLQYANVSCVAYTNGHQMTLIFDCAEPVSDYVQVFN